MLSLLKKLPVTAINYFVNEIYAMIRKNSFKTGCTKVENVVHKFELCIGSERNGMEWNGIFIAFISESIEKFSALEILSEALQFTCRLPSPCHLPPCEHPERWL